MLPIEAETHIKSFDFNGGGQDPVNQCKHILVIPLAYNFINEQR